jgi:hypothetical protein
MDLMTTAQLLGNLGEFLGSIAVVATLIYLAIQIRHSSRQTETQIEQYQYQQWSNSLQIPAASSQVSDLCVRGQQSRTDLSESERFQFDMFTTLAINAVEHAYRNDSDAHNSPDAETWMAVVRLWIDNPGGMEYWKDQRELFYPDFANWIDTRLSQVPGER